MEPVQTLVLEGDNFIQNERKSIFDTFQIQVKIYSNGNQKGSSKLLLPRHSWPVIVESTLDRANPTTSHCEAHFYRKAVKKLIFIFTSNATEIIFDFLNNSKKNIHNKNMEKTI